MAIPTYQNIMLPLLKITGDAKEHLMRDIITQLATEFALTEAERNQLQPSGLMRLFDNRCHWARKYLKEAALVEAVRRGVIQITQAGINVLSSNLTQIDTKYLRQFPAYLEFEKGFKSTSTGTIDLVSQTVEVEEHTPEEVIENSYNRLREILAKDLLDKVINSSPDFFEQLVVDLLLKMGYGGSRADAGHTTQRTADEGIDGTIFEDRLGLDIIYLQAKRWSKDPVGRPRIQEFVGALSGKRAKKGIFITTSRFTKEAIDYVSEIEQKVVLIDGQKLAQLMIDFGVGVSNNHIYEVKQIDSDYFEIE
jgi:restriction system protein